MSGPTRVGFLGCSHVHADGYAHHLASPTLPATATAVFDVDDERARAFAGAHGLEVTSSPEALCDRVDAAVVVSEHCRYADMVEVAAAAAIPVLCEKPLGSSWEDAQRLLRSGAWLSMALPVRYAAGLQRAKRAVTDAGLGAMLAASGVNHGAFPGRFFGTKALSGGGAVIDHVVHLADALRWLTGCEYASVFAETGRFRDVGDVEDCAKLIATTTDGAWFGIDPSWSRPKGMPGANDLVMKVWFERGTMELDAFAQRVTVVTSDGTLGHRGYGLGMDEAMLQDWLQALRSGAAPPIPAIDGWKATELALGALLSSERASPVRLPLGDPAGAGDPGGPGTGGAGDPGGGDRRQALRGSVPAGGGATSSIS